MGFPYQDVTKAKGFILEFAKRLQANKELREGWSKLGMVVGIHLENPKFDFWIDARGKEMQITEQNPGEEGASLTLTCELFHKLYTGQENAMMAFIKRSIKAQGKVTGIMKLTSLMPQAVEVYKSYLQEKGLTP